MMFFRIFKKRKKIKEIRNEAEKALDNLPKTFIENLPELFKLKDMLITTVSVAEAMGLWCEKIKTRGGALLFDSSKDLFSQNIEINNNYDDKIIKTKNKRAYFEKVRAIPKADTWFESVYNKCKSQQETPSF